MTDRLSHVRQAPNLPAGPLRNARSAANESQTDASPHAHSSLAPIHDDSRQHTQTATPVREKGPAEGRRPGLAS
jgi:hypothetical protein